jgi:hypothetical protein
VYDPDSLFLIPLYNVFKCVLINFVFYATGFLVIFLDKPCTSRGQCEADTDLKCV